jgi:hypothetical protein
MGTTSDGVPAAAVNFAELEGTYLSSILGGCELVLGKDAAFDLRCRAKRACRGRAMPVLDGFALICDASTVLADGDVPVPVQTKPPRDREPPPKDPTRGPYIVYPPVPEDERFWPEGFLLRPVNWKPRLYLVELTEMEAFCAAARSKVEPRSEPTGEYFLRRGDHRKAPATEFPMECSGS